MKEKQRDLLLASVLFALGLGWTVTVWQTIPGGFVPGDIGARGFPLVLGIALVILSFSLGVKTFVAEPESGVGTPQEEGPRETGSEGQFGALALALVVAHIAAYGFFMERLGFLLTTVLVVASMLVICVRERTIWKVAAYSIGTAIACWLVFGKLMGVHLPQGTWIMLG